MKRSIFTIFLCSIMVLTFIGFPAGRFDAGVKKVNASELSNQQVSELLKQMTPEEKVGQLFLITFKGVDVSTTSQIYDLIANHHIGGIVLRSANDNFVGPENSVESAYDLIRALQQAEWDTSVANQGGGKDVPPSQYIPLFIGISQEGDSYPNDQILNGVTCMPSLMAIGATWDTDMARQAGAVTGKELSLIGFNLFLGPSLDVLEVLPTLSGEDLGVRTFGGDPYWVGKMGEAYIQGIHEGSSDNMIVVVKHFPGSGGSDRPTEVEVATVQKSLEQLKQIELAPFFQVTDNLDNPGGVTDGLLVTHIRYQGFQGNIRATTRPVSFDQGALDLLMALPQFSQWRSEGGLIVSDDLGSQALHKFYDPTGRNFDARQVARNALMAGNDLLYMDNILSTGDESSYITVIRILESFIQKYKEDSAFARRVDRSVERILAKKVQIYPSFDLNSVIMDKSDLEQVGTGQDVVFDIAQNSVTLISPNPAELSTVLSTPPDITERLVFITDTMTVRQCSTCLEQNIVPADVLQNVILKLYGPQAGGLVISSRLSSYSFNQLLDLMNGKEGMEQIANDLMLADWIIISFLKLEKDSSSYITLKRFLSEQTNVLRNKKVVALGFNAPYYLDATDISKLTAYYGLYSKGPAFFDVAARVLFGETIPEGALPVSVSGIGYDLIQATAPKPDQIIQLGITKVSQPGATLTPTMTQSSQATEEAVSYNVGDTISIKTGIILDKNDHPVPDGTVVRFYLTSQSSVEGSVTQQIDTVTADGIAQIDFRIQSPGVLEIKAASEPAMQSDIIVLDVIGESVSAAITLVVTLPTTPPTETPQPTFTLTPTATETATPEPTATPTATPTPIPTTQAGDWLLSMGLVWVSAAGLFWLSPKKLGVRWRVRQGLLLVIGGILAYSYFALGLGGSSRLMDNMGNQIVILFTLIGVLVGWAAGWVWHYLDTHSFSG